MKPKMPIMIRIAILTLITVVLWIFLNVYRIFTSKPTPFVTPEVIESVNPNLDKNAIEAIVKRLYLDESSVATPIATTPTPEASSSGEISP